MGRKSDQERRAAKTEEQRAVRLQRNHSRQSERLCKTNTSNWRETSKSEDTGQVERYRNEHTHLPQT